MDLAANVARRGTCPRKRVGCAIVSGDNRVLAVGYNGAPFGLPHCEDVGCDLDGDGSCVRAVHAETNALLVAGPAAGATLYVTCSPCVRCVAAIRQAGVVRVVYAERYRQVDGIPDPVALMRAMGMTVDAYALP